MLTPETVALLPNKGLFELRAIAQQLGLGWGKNEKKQSLLDRINLMVGTTQPSDVYGEKEENMQKKAKPAPEVHDNTPDDVTKAVKALIDKGLSVTFNEEEATWHFSYRGAEDSGTLKQPLKIIVRKAEHVTKGARVPRKAKGGELDGAMIVAA